MVLFLVDVHCIIGSGGRCLSGFHGRDGDGFFGRFDGVRVRVRIRVGVLLIEDCSNLGCHVWVIKNREK